MDSFIIQASSNAWYTTSNENRRTGTFLTKSVDGFSHGDYHGGDASLRERVGTIEYVVTKLKNQFGDKTDYVLSEASRYLIGWLREDLPVILRRKGLSRMTVCVIARAKAYSYYASNQMRFRQSVGEAVRGLVNFEDGTNYIERHTNTRTTHMDKSGYGGDGSLPYPGITKDTCHISPNVRGKDILLIDDLYTATVNIDEDAIQALFDNGARSVTFYAVGRTVFRNQY